jgi:hypothetical protein
MEAVTGMLVWMDKNVGKMMMVLMNTPAMKKNYIIIVKVMAGPIMKTIKVGPIMNGMITILI